MNEKKKGIFNWIPFFFQKGKVMQNIKSRIFCSYMIFFILFTLAGPIYSADPVSNNGPNIMDPMDNVLNYDAKIRVGKIIYDNIKDDKDNNRPINWKKIKKDVVNKPIMVQFGIDVGLTTVGTIAQLSLMSVPGGVVAGTFLNAFISGIGGALGYEVSENIRAEKKMSFRETIGTSFQKIDAPMLLNKAVFGVAGAVIGSMIFPGVGTIIGAIAGNIAGAMLTPKIRDTATGKKVFNWVQSGWNKLADWIKGTPGNNLPAPKVPTVKNGSPATSPINRISALSASESARLRQKIQSLQIKMNEYMNTGNSVLANKLLPEIKLLQARLSGYR